MSRFRPLDVLITCEHGGNRIPSRYRALFAGRERLLESHRGYDPGALAMAKAFARTTNASLIAATVSRLLIELNRMPQESRMFSSVVRAAPQAVRDELVRRFYVPYRAAVEEAVRRSLATGARVLHISAHSFTPVLRGAVRRADVGLLYDPRRAAERTFCAVWRHALLREAAGLAVRRNYPYAGTSDGLPTYLRRVFDADQYAGIEFELNQKHVRAGVARFAAMRRCLARALHEAVDIQRRQA